MVPKTSFFICHTLRCGSTLLCDALSSTGIAGHAEEYFPERTHPGGVWVATGAALRDPDTWRCDWTSTPFEQCLDRVLSSGTTPNGVFASKVKWFNMPYLSEMLGVPPERTGLSLADHLDRLFPNLRYVWVTRRDKVRQAVSLVKAKQSAQWKAISAQPQSCDPAEYNFHVVDLALRRIVQEECLWEEYFTRAGVTPFTVVYEDLVRNYESTVRGLLDHFQIGLPREYVFPVPRLHKQADAVSEQWVERYRRDARSSRTRRTVVNLPALLLKQRLAEIKDRHAGVIEEVRGEGMLIGMRAVVPMGQLVDALRAEKLLTVAAGENVVRLLPPLIAGEEEIDQAVDMIDRACTRIERAQAA